MKKKEVTIAKLDIIVMYPSIQFKLVRKSVDYFSKSLSTKEKEKIGKCLETITFGMSSTLVSFTDIFYKYDRYLSEEQGLTIG